MFQVPRHLLTWTRARGRLKVAARVMARWLMIQILHSGSRPGSQKIDHFWSIEVSLLQNQGTWLPNQDFVGRSRSLISVLVTVVTQSIEVTSEFRKIPVEVFLSPSEEIEVFFRAFRHLGPSKLCVSDHLGSIDDVSGESKLFWNWNCSDLSICWLHRFQKIPMRNEIILPFVLSGK